MPIPFRDAGEIEELGAAAFLRFIRDTTGTAVVAGVLLVDARAEPLEFVHHWIALPGGTLWSVAEAWRYAGRRLTAELFRALGRTPGFLLVLDTPASELWLRDLEIGIPAGIMEDMGERRATAVRWLGEAPPLSSPAGRLYDRLASRGLLAESFDRVARALREFHPSLAGEARDQPA